jgi:hypothetical protein
MGQALSPAKPSEQKLQRELDLSGRIGRANGSESCIGDFRVRDSKVGVIQNVEELRSKLKPDILADPEVLVG